MIPSDMQEDADQFSLDELVDSEEEENESIPEDEQFSEAEADEAGDEGGESITEDEQFSEAEADEARDVAAESVPEGKHAKNTWAKYRTKKILWPSLAIGLSLLIGIGVFFIKGKKSETLPDQKEKIPPHVELNDTKGQLLILEPFIIPFEENKKFTYISLSISFNLPNKDIKKEIIEKKDRLRGIIYDILRKEINKIKEVPSLEKLKEPITRGTNRVLSVGKIGRVYITKFLAV